MLGLQKFLHKKLLQSDMAQYDWVEGKIQILKYPIM
jgi:hypothetical protein